MGPEACPNGAAPNKKHFPWGTTMLISEKLLEEFEDYMKSGRLEEDYSYSAEDRKVEIWRIWNASWIWLKRRIGWPQFTHAGSFHVRRR